MSTSPSLEGGTRMTPVGLDIPPDIGQQDWQQVGMQLGAIRDASAWALGDWLVFGERAFGENLVAQAVEVTGRSKATLVKYRWVAEHIPTEQRWVGLSFTHHEIVARLPVEIAHDWLEAAYREGWSVEELRGHVRPDSSTQKSSRADLVAALERIAEQQPKTLAMIQNNGFVFDDIGNEPGNWQHLAFSIYTDLCEIDTIARGVLDEHGDH